MNKVWRDVLLERNRQDRKWGEQNHRPDRWIVILDEEKGEACRNILECEPIKYREEMIQVAAVAIAAIECYDRHNYSILDFKKLREGGECEKKNETQS